MNSVKSLNGHLVHLETHALQNVAFNRREASPSSPPLVAWCRSVLVWSPAVVFCEVWAFVVVLLSSWETLGCFWRGLLLALAVMKGSPVPPTSTGRHESEPHVDQDLSTESAPHAPRHDKAPQGSCVSIPPLSWTEGRTASFCASAGPRSSACLLPSIFSLYLQRSSERRREESLCFHFCPHHSC